jgi:CxxC motif-containing protein (DUF1111 family)
MTIKLRRICVFLAFGALLPTNLTLAASPESQALPNNDHRTREERFTQNGVLGNEGPSSYPNSPSDATEAPAGFDNLSNGFLPQGAAFDTLNGTNIVSGRSFNDNRFFFEEIETIADGLGPTYNAQSCRECHQNIVTGGASQITEQRSGHTFKHEFFDSLGGNLIQSRATFPDIVEHVAPGDTIRTFRISTTTLGTGFIECIANNTLLAIRDAQPAKIRGTALMVPILEITNGLARIGRFGWKSQHASLVSFSADAYLNEIGITSPLMPEENTSNGEFVGFGTPYDPVPEPEDDGGDITAFAGFMRSTKAPSRGTITQSAQAGANLFTQVGCAACHIPSITTARAGTVINGGAFTVPAALGNKIIHPYSDFLLHDIGSGDGIPVLSTVEYEPTATQIRTALLWGLRTRNRLMHDGLSLTVEDAIQRHRGQASEAAHRYHALSGADKQQLLDFLDSL